MLSLALLFYTSQSSTHIDTNRGNLSIFSTWVNYDSQLEAIPLLHTGLNWDSLTEEVPLSFVFMSTHSDPRWAHSYIIPTLVHNNSQANRDNTSVVFVSAKK